MVLGHVVSLIYEKVQRKRGKLGLLGLGAT